jgi:hypothetical protein
MSGQFSKLFNWAIIIAGVAGIIYPAFLDPYPGLTQIFASLFRP